MNRYRPMCFSCGEKNYIIRDDESLEAITGLVGKCDECGQIETFIVYAIDWEHAENASKYSGKYD